MAKKRENPTNEIQFRGRKQQEKIATRQWKACFASLLFSLCKSVAEKIFCFFKMFRSILLLCVTILSNTCKSAENCYISLYFIFNYGSSWSSVVYGFAGSKNTMLKSHIKTMNKVQSVVKMIEATLAGTHACTHSLTYPHFSGENNTCERIHTERAPKTFLLYSISVGRLHWSWKS